MHNYENVAQSLPASLGILGMENGIHETQKSPSLPPKGRTADKCVDGFEVRLSTFGFNDL